ncbi:MAG: MerR family transcriptional regulator [bacterium]|nr:MerR family transcriptional regulator [bacterium]
MNKIPFRGEFMMEEQYYRIGEVSKITGVSKDTLHFYDKIGLLIPEYIDENNRYRYYSRWNLWQLDIITMCRKLDISIDQIRAVLQLHDNDKITQVLSEYQKEALRLSNYYKQVAEDIEWYKKENASVSKKEMDTEVRIKYLKEEKVIAGVLKREDSSYHANLQEAARNELMNSNSIRRRYGYILDLAKAEEGIFYKKREYLKIEEKNFKFVEPENVLILPAGEYAVTQVQINHDKADFTHLFDWLKQKGYTAGEIYAEEQGLQLFDYLHDYRCEIKVRIMQ